MALFRPLNAEPDGAISCVSVSASGDPEKPAESLILLGFCAGYAVATGAVSGYNMSYFDPTGCRLRNSTKIG
jgi:hypothetical protein